MGGGDHVVEFQQGVGWGGAGRSESVDAGGHIERRAGGGPPARVVYQDSSNRTLVKRFSQPSLEPPHVQQRPGVAAGLGRALELVAGCLVALTIVSAPMNKELHSLQVGLFNA